MITFGKDFLPKIEVIFRKGYSWKLAYLDTCAALSIAMISLPLSIAFAIAAGATPQQGIVCGIVLGFFASLLGGSLHAISGPTGAFVVVIFDVIARNGMNGLGTATILAGFILILLGLFRLGDFIKFIPFSLIIGFTTALGTLILLAQIKDCLGLPALKEPGFTSLVFHLITHLKNPNSYSILISLLTLGSAFFLKNRFPKWPWAVLSITLATVVAQFFALEVPTLGSKFGSLSLFPWPALPKFDFALIPSLFSDGFTIAALCGIESLLCCLVADSMTGTRHRSNVELVAQGVGTMACGFLGGIPGTNALSRTAANIRAGGQTPLAGVLHALFLASIFAFCGPLCVKIPLAALSSVLILIAWNMAHYDRFIEQFKAPIPDILVMMVTFLLTIFIDITVAVQIGMILASFLFVYQQSKRFTLLNLTSDDSQQESNNLGSLPPSTEIYEMQGSLFFGAIDRLKELLNQTEVPHFLIIKMNQVPEIDASGMNILKTLHGYLLKRHCMLYLVGLKPYIKKGLDQYGVTKIFSEDCFCQNLSEVIKKIQEKNPSY
jgi:SulP family sulfate permease